MPEFSTQINSEITETLAVLCPGTRIDYVTVIVVAIFISLLYCLCMTMLFIVFHVVLVKNRIHTTHVTFGKLIYVYPVVAAQQVFHFAIIFRTVTAEVQTTVDFRVITEEMRELCIEVPVQLVCMAFFNHVDGTMTGSISRIFLLALVDMIQVVPVDMADVVRISHPT